MLYTLAFVVFFFFFFCAGVGKRPKMCGNQRVGEGEISVMR